MHPPPWAEAKPDRGISASNERALSLCVIAYLFRLRSRVAFDSEISHGASLETPSGLAGVAGWSHPQFSQINSTKNFNKYPGPPLHPNFTLFS